MNWKHYLMAGVGFVVTAFLVNLALDYFGLTAYIYQPATALGLKKSA
jgi:hypothetical protein